MIPADLEALNASCKEAEAEIEKALGALVIKVAPYISDTGDIRIKVRPFLTWVKDDSGALIALSLKRVTVDVEMYGVPKKSTKRNRRGKQRGESA